MAKKLAKRPQTIREIQAEKAKQQDQGTMILYNCSRQVISIHLDPPKGVDFYVGAQDIRLKPKQTHTFKRDRLRIPQIDRLRKQGMLEVIHDSEKQHIH
jgi:hypothetical protein